MIEHPKLPQPKAAFIIYDPKVDKYSRGGNTPTWSKKPKMWSGLGNLKNHLAMFITIEFDGPYDPFLRKKKYGIARWQPYHEGCIVFDIVANAQVCTIHELYNEMIEARIAQDKKDQDKRTNEMIKKIRNMNDGD